MSSADSSSSPLSTEDTSTVTVTRSGNAVASDGAFANTGVVQGDVHIHPPQEQNRLSAFVDIRAIAADRQDSRYVLNDVGPTAGREREAAALRDALSRSKGFPDLVLVTGPGGRGKTRLLVEVLTQFQTDHPDVPVLYLSRGRPVDADALAELPCGPAMIVIDDVHESPESVELLLNHARRVPGSQLVLSSRLSGIAAVRGTAVKHEIPVSQISEISIRELTKPQARELVESLTEGLDLPYAVRSYLAQQAIDTPYVAVIAANLIRRGDLAAPLVVDPGFREEILRRYEEQATGRLEGFDERTVRRLLATHAALGPIEHEDVELKRSLATFCDLDFKDLLLLTKQLQDRGVLVTRSGYTRMVPDVLADHILEQEAVVEEFDVGFVRELWQAFGSTHGPRLVVALSELDWRLTRQGGPSVFTSIWPDVVEELRSADYRALRTALPRLKELAHTQPRLMIELLEEIRARLNSAGSGSDTERTDLEGALGGSSGQALLGLPPVGPADVLAAMAPLYGGCAASDAGLLETALDALWDLRRRDPRPPNQDPDHPERVLADHLANFDALPDASFPLRIVARVRAWLDQGRADGDVVTPLFALGPLLAKEGIRFVAQDARALAGSSYFVWETWARPHRDDIRDVLRHLGCGPDLRLAGEAVTLLGSAARQVHGFFGQTVDASRITAWEDDDLQTLAVLTEIANRTTSGALRRHIRDQVSWLAYRARSLPVRHAALQLLTNLDNRSEDDLAEVLLNARGDHDPSRRGVPLPTMTELQAEVEAKAGRDAELTQAQRDTERDADLRTSVERMGQEAERRCAQVVDDLVAARDPVALVRAIDQGVKEVEAVKPGHAPGVYVLQARIGQAAPELAGPLTRTIAAASSTALDADLHLLIGAWIAYNEDVALTWLRAFPEQRTEVRLAVAAGFLHQGWAGRGESFAEIHRLGMRDPDPHVRDTFLAACHTMLAADPAATIGLILDAGISARAARDALDLASRHHGENWGVSLGETDAAAVLRLVDHAGWEHWNIEQIVSGIVVNHPALVLNHLLRLHQTDQSLPHAVDGLAQAFAEHGQVLAQWLYDHRQEQRSVTAVAALVLDPDMSADQADHLAALTPEVEGKDLAGFTQLLADVPLWPLRHAGLARQLLGKSQAHGQEIHDAVREQLLSAMHVRSYGWANGQSRELEDVRSAVSACLSEESDSELRSLFEHALADLDRQTEWLRRSYEQEEDDAL